VRDLDGDHFEVGETFSSNLAAKAELARAAIGKHLVGQPSVEARRLLKELHGQRDVLRG
jgi:hypothetical protein